jgi:hypothetical protein
MEAAGGSHVCIRPAMALAAERVYGGGEGGLEAGDGSQVQVRTAGIRSSSGVRSVGEGCAHSVHSIAGLEEVAGRGSERFSVGMRRQYL